MPPIYTAVATAEGKGRDGHVSSPDGVLDLDVASPTELGGPGGAANPELFFAAGYASCFHSAVLHSARLHKVRLANSSVTASIALSVSTDGRFGLSASLRVSVPGVDAATARDLIDLANRMCPYSNAVRGNVDVSIEVETAAACKRS